MADKFNTMHFLEEYQRYPCLWDKSIEEYKSRGKRDFAEECLMESLQINDVKLLRQKIRSIRCTYNQEVSKIRNSKGTGSGSKTVYKPKLSWFEFANSFLCRNVENNIQVETNLVINESVNTATSENNLENNNVSCAELSPCVTTQPYENYENPTGENSKNITSTACKPKKIRKIDNSLDNAVEALKFVCTQKSEVNEFSIFGQHIAAQLQKLPLQESLKIQVDIQNMLTTARLRIMNNTPNSNNMSNTSTSQSPIPSEMFMSQDMFDCSVQSEPYVDMVKPLPLAKKNTTIIKSPSYNYEQDDSSNTVTLFYNNWQDE